MISDGIKGENWKATLKLYLFGIIIIAPIAALIGIIFGATTAFQATPFLVVVLVLLQLWMMREPMQSANET